MTYIITDEVKNKIAKNSFSFNDEDCIFWLGSKDGKGYGKIVIAGHILGMHRVVYEIAHGKIEDGLFVLHSCDQPACININHLFLGTPADNMTDMRRKNRGLNQHGKY